MAGAKVCRNSCARAHGFPNRLGAAGIVISGMNAELIDARRGVQNAERIKEMDLVALFGQADGGGGAVNSGAGDGNFDLCIRHG